MKRFIIAHKSLSTLAGLFLCLCLIGAIFFMRNIYGNYQAQQRIEHTLKYNGYTNIVPRSSVRKESTGPFSGISWYEYTFSTEQTLATSYEYQDSFHQKSKHLTMKNCPIVYRVILTPPGTKIKHWTTEIYLDTNQALRDGNQTDYIQHLNDNSRRSLKMKTQDSN